MKKVGLMAIIFIAVALASCLTSSQVPEKNDSVSAPRNNANISDVSEPSMPDTNFDFGEISTEHDPAGPSISISKQIIDINNNGQLDEGEKVNITYGAYGNEYEVRFIRVVIDGYVIDAQSRDGTYSVTTDPLSIGEHRIVVLAVNSEKKQEVQEIKINVAGKGPSFYFPPMWRYDLKKGESFEVVISAVNPMGNPKAKALLILKPPGNGISFVESWCKGFEGMCTGEYELEPGDTVRAISLHMQADKPGRYKMDAEIRYKFENDNSPTIPRYQTINIVVHPLPGEVQKPRR